MYNIHGLLNRLPYVYVSEIRAIINMLFHKERERERLARPAGACVCSVISIRSLNAYFDRLVPLSVSFAQAAIFRRLILLCRCAYWNVRGAFSFAAFKFKLASHSSIGSLIIDSIYMYKIDRGYRAPSELLNQFKNSYHIRRSVRLISATKFIISL